MNLEPLEEAVLKKLLDGNHPVLEALRQQLPAVSVKARESTGAGFYTEFSIAEGARAAPLQSGKLLFGDVEATIDGLKYGAGFVLYVERGLLHMLEGYSYEEPWPEHVIGFTLRYGDPERKTILSKLG